MPRMRGSRGATFLVVFALVVPACGARVDPRRDLAVEAVTTGWFDVGVVEGRKNKLVPTVSFRLKNASSASIDTVQVNAVFRRAGEQEAWDTTFARAVGADGLASGGSTKPLVLRAKLGYTGEQSRAEMLQHRQFQDAKVELFAKVRAGAWVRLADFPIDRQLLTQ